MAHSKLEKLLKNQNLTEADAAKILQAHLAGELKQFESIKVPLNSPHVRFTVISDSHMGHKCYRPDILDNAIKSSKKFGSEFWLHCGDILEGMSGRDGHIYELTHIGATNQLNYAESELSKISKPIYAITASNSHDGWFSSKANAGFEVGTELERRLPNFKFLGYDEADLVLDNGLRLRLLHPGGGTAYAISYKGQKYLNCIGDEDKPNAIFQGHFHKSMQFYNRNIHFFDAGTLEAQTNFMRSKMTPAMMGYWLIDATTNKGKINSITPTFVPFEK